MADKDAPHDEPSLEMPSFSLRRRKAAAGSRTPEPAPTAEQVSVPEPGPAREPQPVLAPVPEPSPAAEPVRRPARDAVRLPQPSGMVAVLVTGAVVGLLAVASVWLSTTACGAVRGTSSCGGGPGLVIWVATLLLLAYLGGWLLRALGVGEAGSTSVLGLGAAVVVLLAFFSQAFDQAWMVAVTPLVTMAGYALAWWITTQDSGDDSTTKEPELHDIE